MERPPYPDTPELDRLSKVSNESQVAGEFLEWLLGTKGYNLSEIKEERINERECTRCRGKGTVRKGAELCRRCNGEGTVWDYTREHEVMVWTGTQELLAEFFGIDQNKVEAERRAVLEWCQQVTPA